MAGNRIDTHHHPYPPIYIEKTGDVLKHTTHAFYDRLKKWKPSQAIEAMDKDGIAVSVLSVSTPSTWLGDTASSRTFTREVNDAAAKMQRDHRGRFGHFAALALPDVEGSLREIEYAFDTLKADGICLMTSYQSRYLGDPAFAPVMDELNRRKAVVFTHPVRPDCCRNLVPDVAEPVIELATDTTRTVASVLFSGTATRCPDIRFIWSHGGGTVPFLTMRLVNWANARKDLKDRLPDGPVAALRKFYYDTAQAAHPYALSALLRLVSTSQVVFGTDFPFVTAAATAQGLKDFGLGGDDLAAIDRGNVAALLPRLRAG
jgi:predicted TIM-barrel fold metal-dependent hydrolase